MHFWSKADKGVCEARACLAFFTTSNTGVWLIRICQEDLSYEIWGIFCYAVLFPFFFLKLWKVIHWIKCKLSFPDNWSSYIVNVILLLKGFYSIFVPMNVLFLGNTRNTELSLFGLDFPPVEVCGPGLENKWLCLRLEGRFGTLARGLHVYQLWKALGPNFSTSVSQPHHISKSPWAKQTKHQPQFIEERGPGEFASSASH